MNKKSLESLLDAQLITQGFRKKASSWYRQAEGALQVVDLQKSSYGMQFYVNLCCVPIGMEVEGMPTPKEHKCPVRIRLTSAFPDQREKIEKVFDLDAVNIPDSEREEWVVSFAREFILPFLDYMKDAPSLRRAIEQGRFKQAWVNLTAQKHLGVS
jgi:hypothetical protein